MTSEAHWLDAIGPVATPAMGRRRDRPVGVRSFDLTAKSTGSYQRFGRTKNVLYTDAHDPRVVVETWLDANAEAVEGAHKPGLYLRVCNRYGDEFKRAAREAWRDRGWDLSPKGTQSPSVGHTEWNEFVQKCRKGEVPEEVPDADGDGE